MVVVAGFEPAVYGFVDRNVIFIKPGIVYSSMCRRSKNTLTMTFVCYLLTLKTRGRMDCLKNKIPFGRIIHLYPVALEGITSYNFLYNKKGSGDFA
jgi:hypothetical protein